jgi:hypothetical protein
MTHPERAKAVKRAWYRSKPKEYHTANKRRLTYGELPVQPSVCDGCSKPSDQLVVDHNHADGKVRGWLCQGCNKILGFAKDSRDRLQLLINYLDKAELLK